MEIISLLLGIFRLLAFECPATVQRGGGAEVLTSGQTVSQEGAVRAQELGENRAPTGLTEWSARQSVH